MQKDLFEKKKRRRPPKLAEENRPPDPSDIGYNIGRIEKYVRDATSAADRGWRVAVIFKRIYCPWASDETVRQKWHPRLMKQRNRLVGERGPNGKVLGRPQASIHVALGLAQTYAESPDLHGRTEEGALKDLPEAGLNILTTHVSQIVDDHVEPEEDGEWERIIDALFD